MLDDNQNAKKMYIGTRCFPPACIPSVGRALLRRPANYTLVFRQQNFLFYLFIYLF